MRAHRLGGRLLAAVTAAALIAGCSSGAPGTLLSTGSLPAVTGYQEGNAITPQGYQLSGSLDSAVRVTVTGSASTPNERLLKIALARAAHYGAEHHKKTFRPAEPAYSVNCGKTNVIERGTKRAVSPADYRIVALDVTFGRAASADPADRPSKETATALLAELQSETIPPETQAALVAQLAQACGRTT